MNADFCPACSALQPPPEGADLFSFLGVPFSLEVEDGKLQRLYHERSKKLHPDRFLSAGGKLLEYSQARSALLNKAYRTLRDPEERLRYLLAIELESLGLSEAKAAERNVPVELAEEYFEMQEALAEGDQSALGRVHARLAEVAAENEKKLAELRGRWEREGLGEARARGDKKDERSAFARDLEKALQLKSYLFRMEENLGRAAAVRN
ncbi:MAG: hypothetical protein AB1405_08010 [Bdellovibrionota bacterium]